ncbi:MAG: response regulator [candidate division KSB1 bacterium]|nr:response regulator [candidate division KSB1 bacterium]MDZ7303864.1 response regulator [candidate division KSB1 bacterium]MDZ7313212.1 response regulator [candidate division KSB1 bacterium]
MDANARHCLLYQMEMEARGYEVVCAHNGHEALQQIQQSRFDVAVVDVMLPDINGVELVKKLSITCRNSDGRSTNGYKSGGRSPDGRSPGGRSPDGRSLPIIINTAYPCSKNRIKQLNADAFVLKSSDLDELMGKIYSLSRTHCEQRFAADGRK